MKKNMMILEREKNQSREIKDIFASTDGIDDIHTIHDGGEALDYLDEVDIIVMELLVPTIDGLGLLEQIYQMEQDKPSVIVVSTIGTEDVVKRCLDLGASYYMIKPVDLDNLQQRVLELSGVKESRFAPSRRRDESVKTLDEKITNIFLMVGIPAHIKGYQYLRQGIKLVVEDASTINGITKELYPNVANHFETSDSRVERAMRHAIEVAWQRGKLENINEVFGYNVYNNNYKPTNGEFIALIAEKLSMEENI